jgi:hypothetical protein
MPLRLLHIQEIPLFLSFKKMLLQWHISKDENFGGISQIRNNCGTIYLINP